jgi:hypothetical protein
MLFCVRSGFNTGADLGAILAAHKCGIATAGWIPKGHLTENGPSPELANLGAIETKSDKYPPRTYANVKDSDGTIRVASNFNSYEELCTLNAIKFYGRPYLDIKYSNVPQVNTMNMLDLNFIEPIINWIRNHKISKLNIAGNRESVAPGIQEFTERLFIEVFKEMWINNLVLLNKNLPTILK